MRVVKLMKIGKENLRKLEVVSLAFNLLSIRTPSLIQVSLHIISFIVFAATRAFAQVYAGELSLQQLHLPTHSSLQLQTMISRHALAAGGKDVHCA